MNNTRILIVEDEVIVAMDIEQRLIGLGYSVMSILDNGEEVLDFMETIDLLPDLVLLDINLNGEMSGIEVSETIKSRFNVPVVFLTANSSIDVVEKAQDTEPYGFVFKPFNSTDLKVSIEIAQNKFTYEKKLKVLNSELEERVRKRTKELQVSNDHLSMEIEIRNVIEEKLIASKTLFENTVRNIGSGLAISDKKGKIISVNHSLVKTTGFSEKTLIKKKISGLIGEKKWQEIVKYLKSEEHNVWNGEHLVSINKKFKYCHFFVSKVNESKDSEYVVSVIDVDDAKRNRALYRKERKKRLLSLFEGEENERKRISKELHDSLGQKLTAAKLSIGSILINATESSKLYTTLSESKEIIEESIQEIRDVSQNLFPSVLSDFGLESALEKIAERINNTGKLKCKISSTGNMKLINQKDKSFELNLYRLCQEGISNAVKHSKATRIEVKLFNTDNMFSVRITDNGIGMDLSNVNLGSGINNMRERASAMQSEFFINSKLGKGTEIIIRLEYGE